MGNITSENFIELVEEKKEAEAIDVLDRACWINPNHQNAHGDTALHLCCSLHLPQLCSKLVEHHCNVNKLNFYKSSPLHLAVREGHNDLVTTLLASGRCDVNLVGAYKLNALTIACACNHLQVAQTLLNVPNIVIQDRALLFAALHENGSDLCALLLQNGADPNGTDKYGNSALMQASLNMNDAVVSTLLQAHSVPAVPALPASGAIDVNRGNSFGWTALHFAYAAQPKCTRHDAARKNANETSRNETSRARIIRLLLQHGASPNIADKNGIKPTSVMPAEPASDTSNALHADESENKRNRRNEKNSRNERNNENEAGVTPQTPETPEMAWMRRIWTGAATAANVIKRRGENVLDSLDPRGHMATFGKAPDAVEAGQAGETVEFSEFSEISEIANVEHGAQGNGATGQVRELRQFRPHSDVTGVVGRGSNGTKRSFNDLIEEHLHGTREGSKEVLEDAHDAEAPAAKRRRVSREKQKEQESANNNNNNNNNGGKMNLLSQLNAEHDRRQRQRSLSLPSGRGASTTPELKGKNAKRGKNGKNGKKRRVRNRNELQQSPMKNVLVPVPPRKKQGKKSKSRSKSKSKSKAKAKDKDKENGGDRKNTRNTSVTGREGRMITRSVAKQLKQMQKRKVDKFDEDETNEMDDNDAKVKKPRGRKASKHTRRTSMTRAHKRELSPMKSKSRRRK